jgi:hypothetical protein
LARSESLLLRTQRATFHFVQATPDAVRFAGLQSMRQTLIGNGTRSAHLLCTSLAVVTLVLRLDAHRGKEGLCERALAPCLTLPSETGTAMFFFAA